MLDLENTISGSIEEVSKRVSIGGLSKKLIINLQYFIILV